MPPSLGEAVLYLLGDDTKLKDTVSKAGKETQASLTKIGQGMQKAGGLLTLGITTPLVAMGFASVDAASNLSESINAVNVVFQEGADQIKEYAKTADESAGLSARSFNELATVTGAFLRNVGFDADQAGKETIKLTERAADMASVFNKDVDQALAAIQSGLKGEFNPLEAFGVKINAAAIEARAFALGLENASGELDDNAKAAAALDLIYTQTAITAGDFKNTSDGLANAQRIQKAAFENMSAELGERFLPIATQVVTTITDLIDRFRNLSPETQNAVLAGAAFLAILGPLLIVIGTLITSISAMIPVITAVAGVMTFPLIAIIGAVIAIMALLAIAWANDWGGIRAKTAELIQNIKQIIDSSFKQIQAWWAEHGDDIKAKAKAAWDAIKLGIDTVLGIIERLFATFKLAFEGDWYGFGQALRQNWDDTWAAIKKSGEQFWEDLKAGVEALIESIKAFFTETDWGAVGTSIVNGLADGINASAGLIKDAALAAARAAYEAIKGFFGIHSNSALTTELGLNVGGGLVDGINATDPRTISPLGGQFVIPGSTSSTTNYNLTANYPKESPTSLVDRVRLLRLAGV